MQTEVYYLHDFGRLRSHDWSKNLSFCMVLCTRCRPKCIIYTTLVASDRPTGAKTLVFVWVRALDAKNTVRF